MTNANDTAFTGPTDKGFTPGLTKREYMTTRILASLIIADEGERIDILSSLIKQLNESNE